MTSEFHFIHFGQGVTWLQIERQLCQIEAKFLNFPSKEEVVKYIIQNKTTTTAIIYGDLCRATISNLSNTEVQQKIIEYLHVSDPELSPDYLIVNAKETFYSVLKNVLEQHQSVKNFIFWVKTI